MLNELRENKIYFYKNILKWSLTKYNLELEILLKDNSNCDGIVKNIQFFGFCNDWFFQDNNYKFICKWDLRRIKNIKQIEVVSELLINDVIQKPCQ